MRADELFTLPADFPFAEHFPPHAAPWDWLRTIASALRDIKRRVPDSLPPGLCIQGEVYLEDGVELPPFGMLIGPAWIGRGTQIRPGAYVRGNVIAGRAAVLGNSCEFKNCLLLDGAQVPHFSYVGDSILGVKAHLGAGVICSNLRLDQQTVSVRLAGGQTADTGLRKVGAFLGDHAEAGCNSVLNPGTILGRRALVMPSVAVSGLIPANHIARVRQRVEFLERRD
jgi:UDP-N-acetylglucosamine diphosphorylase / glucose-1-phosphate thymidylyltransferase / UDP-N-acetylgalactosamine diphosphorylase / glucosamine-1-phosphate N-acetyltransferase / galactosamine-1-phosphate N-acetyltransferase